MLDQPSPHSILECVVNFLRDRAIPALPDREAFEARIAANALDLVRRELAEGPALAADEHARLVALLGTEGSLAELNELVATRIRDGELDADMPGLREHLFATSLEKLRVDQPRYATYLQVASQQKNKEI